MNAHRRKAKEFITDMLVRRAQWVGSYRLIRRAGERPVQRPAALFKKDIESAVGMITLYVPALGLLSGGITTFIHVIAHMANRVGEAAASGGSKEDPRAAE